VVELVGQLHTWLLEELTAPLAVALGLFGRPCIEQLLLSRAGDNVQEHAFAGAHHQGFAGHSAFEEG
jgi:hypothetical protein